jgi:hypothetical protein
MLLTLSNGLIGAVCGLWLRVYVLVPLVIAAFLEVAITEHSRSWWSASRVAIALLVAIEAGYLAGASAVAVWSTSSRRGVSRTFVMYRHKRMSSH